MPCVPAALGPQTMPSICTSAGLRNWSSWANSRHKVTCGVHASARSASLRLHLYHDPGFSNAVVARPVPTWSWQDMRADRFNADYNRRQLGNERYTIAGEGLSNTTPVGAVLHKWEAVFCLAETATHVFIFANHYVYLWPKRQAPE